MSGVDRVSRLRICEGVFREHPRSVLTLSELSRFSGYGRTGELENGGQIMEGSCQPVSTVNHGLRPFPVGRGLSI